MNTPILNPAISSLELPPYSLKQEEKRPLLLAQLKALTLHHYDRCSTYRNIVDRVFGGLHAIDFNHLEGLPFLPVSLFKTHELKSIPDTEVVKVLTSSGTTGQSVSRIYLDRQTAQSQAAVLVKIMQHCLGKKRLPMIVVDHPNVIRDRHSYSARGAGILGMSQFGYRPFYALREDMSLDVDGLLAYLSGYDANTPLFLFGFTYIVWQHFILALQQSGISLTLPKAILIHSGGWKKLQDIAVDPASFRERVDQVTGIQQCLNFYGMVEQVGSIFLENPLHYLQAPIYADVLIRDPRTFEVLPVGQPGLIQVVSTLPISYPGHSLLTEDLGVLRGVDHPELDMQGQYFEVLGRVPKSEVRGCSDTFQPSTMNNHAA
jgi:hypothetical protein